MPFFSSGCEFYSWPFHKVGTAFESSEMPSNHQPTHVDDRRAEFAGLPMPNMGLEVQVTKLMVGDYAWAWRRRENGVCTEGAEARLRGEKMFVVDGIVERKSPDDVVGSVEDLTGRYNRQKRKMSLSGLTKLVYLLEGNHEGHKKRTTGADTSSMNRTVEVTTQAQGFAVNRTKDKQGTADFLLSMSFQLMNCQGLELVADFCNNPRRLKVSLKEFALAINTLDTPTVNLLFGKLLTTVNGVSAAGALAISRAFGSPLDLANAMRQCGTAKEKLDLVQNLRLSDGGKKNSTQRLGPSVAGKLVSLFDPTTDCPGGVEVFDKPSSGVGVTSG
eukprot:jgi/Undpi1/11359/HiC_scaffold_30.g13656.m1